MKESQSVFNTARVVGESERRCPKLKPIVIPDLVKIVIDKRQKKIQKTRNLKLIDDINLNQVNPKSIIDEEETFAQNLQRFRK